LKSIDFNVYSSLYESIVKSLPKTIKGAKNITMANTDYTKCSISSNSNYTH